MIWKTDVLYVEDYSFHSMECLHWQSILTDIMVAVPHSYYIVNTACGLNFDKLLWRRDFQADGAGSCSLNLFFGYWIVFFYDVTT